MLSTLQHLAQALPQPEVLPLYLITLGIAIAHAFVQPALEPVGSCTTQCPGYSMTLGMLMSPLAC